MGCLPAPVAIGEDGEGETTEVSINNEAMDYFQQPAAGPPASGESDSPYHCQINVEKLHSNPELVSSPVTPTTILTNNNDFFINRFRVKGEWQPV